MIEELETPIVKSKGLSVVTLTHRAWGHTHQPWNNPPLTSYNVLGGFVDGKFVVLEGSEEYAPIAGEDYDALMASSESGKPAGMFRTDDIIAKHKEILSRMPATAPVVVPE